MGVNVRKGYELPRGLRRERLKGSNFTCETCNKKTRKLEVHHLIACYIASRNSLLTPAIIKTIENTICLCHECHVLADKDQLTWTAHDISIIAWALFDLNPKRVEEYQNGTYTNIYDNSKSKRKERKRRRKDRRRSKKKNNDNNYLVS